MCNFDTDITGGTVVREDGQYEVDVGVRDGKVAALLGRGFGDYNARDLIDASGLYVLPGLTRSAYAFWPRWRRRLALRV